MRRSVRLAPDVGALALHAADGLVVRHEKIERMPMRSERPRCARSVWRSGHSRSKELPRSAQRSSGGIRLGRRQRLLHVLDLFAQSARLVSPFNRTGPCSRALLRRTARRVVASAAAPRSCSRARRRSCARRGRSSRSAHNQLKFAQSGFGTSERAGDVRSC